MLENTNSNLWSLITVLSMFIDLIAFFAILSLIGKRKIPRFDYLLRALTLTLSICVIDFFNIYPNLEVLLCIVLCTIFYKTSYKDSIYKCVIISLLFWLILMLIGYISIGFVLIVNKLENIHVLLDSNIYRLQVVIISKFLLSIKLLLFNHFKLSLSFKFKNMALITIPIVSNIVSLLLIIEYNLTQNIINRRNSISLVIVVLLIVLSCAALIIIVEKIIKDDEIKLEYELVSDRIRTNHKNYENMNDVHNKIRYMYHDLRNHMICLKNFKNIDDIISYINNLEFYLDDFEYYKNTGNKTLDIILSEKKHLCKKNSIDMIESINISKLDFINDVDICAIFTNALDNAIEACINIGKDKPKVIEVKATYINKFAIIKFTNTKANKINIINDCIQTTKDNNKMHGIGLASIKYVVRKYNGEVIINYSDNNFILKIMIPIDQSNENNKVNINTMA